MKNPSEENPPSSESPSVEIRQKNPAADLGETGWKKKFDDVFLTGPNFCTKFDPLNDFFKQRASYHFKE